MRFRRFPKTPFPRRSGLFRIKWNYLLLSHQRKVADSARDLRRARKVYEVDSDTNLFKEKKSIINEGKIKRTKKRKCSFSFLYQSCVITGCLMTAQSSCLIRPVATPEHLLRKNAHGNAVRPHCNVQVKYLLFVFF